MLIQGIAHEFTYVHSRIRKKRVVTSLARPGQGTFDAHIIYDSIARFVCLNITLVILQPLPSHADSRTHANASFRFRFQISPADQQQQAYAYLMNVPVRDTADTTQMHTRGTPDTRTHMHTRTQTESSLNSSRLNRDMQKHSNSSVPGRSACMRACMIPASEASKQRIKRVVYLK